MRWLLGLVVAVALGLVACGDSDVVSYDDLTLKEYCEDVYCSASICEGSGHCEIVGSADGEPVTFCEFVGSYLLDPARPDPMGCEAEWVSYLRCERASGMCGGNLEECGEEHAAFADCFPDSLPVPY